MTKSVSQTEGTEELESSSLVELAIVRLRQEILSGTLVPGERLVEEALTRRFGISRGPLREALRLLAQQGLVEHLPRRGSRVARLSDRDVEELFELRGLLERFAVESAPLKPGPGFDALEAALTVMGDAALQHDPLSEAQAHLQFHTALVALADNQQLLLVYQLIIDKLQLYMNANLRREAVERDPLEGVERHRRLMLATLRADRAAALNELDHHGARTFFH